MAVTKEPKKTNSIEKKSKEKKQFSLKSLAILLLIGSFFFGIIGGYLGANLIGNRITSLDSTAAGERIVSSQSDLISKIAKDVSPSVVSINVKGASTRQSFFGDVIQQPTEGAGTGIILSSDGVILTNRHVVDDNNIKNISITTSDGKTYSNVTLTAKDPRANYDIAFLKVNGVNNLQPAKLGNSDEMQVGSAVVAIGYALGEFSNTVTSGIISGLGRPVVASDQSGTNAETLTNLFQTDAAINPGNSGGPLVNMNGEVIGINTAVAGDAQNIGFAIPINDVKPQISSVLSSGKLEVPYLGVRYLMLNSDIKNRFNLSRDSGAFLKGDDSGLAVIPGSPADKAGLKEGDIIVKINNQELNDKNTLGSVIGKLKVGDEVELTYVRDGKEQTVKTKLEPAPNTNQ